MAEITREVLKKHRAEKDREMREQLAKIVESRRRAKLKGPA